MAYNFYLDGVLLPIAPSKLQTKISNKNNTITLINEGEVNLLKRPGLTEITFDVIIPQMQYPFASYQDGFKPAAYFLDKIEKLKTEESKFQFIVSRVSPKGNLLFDTNIKVSLEDYTITEDAKNGFDLMISIKLKQYRDFGVKTATITQQQTNEKAVAVLSTSKSREVSKVTPKTHVVVKGETLWSICKKYLGNGAKYPEIAKLNGIKNPNIIHVGQVIRLE
ncbi:LysM peptidoglycan-binding domain-containing protein [Paenibacillus lentus]|uniref:LysM peptidoglycan-binding domain-containing protein n=1 Tax=Paenibacillus lentus TaxID=1338368 RepID=A0A3S8S0Y0_9BACL|nr:LysM peptidoglycan-binding domain-containing protein [Paenibacillus lentus]AZK48788.1 LysM peptidoglycan-binding domain-containing protein [Paenibacillus lentus]